MRKLIILVSILLLLVASSCSMGGNDAGKSTEELINAAIAESIDKTSPSSVAADGSKTYVLSDYQAGNGVVFTGTIVIDADGTVVSISITEFKAGGAYGSYEAEQNGEGELISTTKTVKDIGIILKDSDTVLYENAFYPSQFLVSVQYSDGSERLLDGSNIIIAEYEKDPETGSNVWRGKVEATYAGITKTAVFSVKGSNESGDEPVFPKVIVSADIVQTGVFLVGQAFDSSRFEVNVTYSDATRETLSGVSVSCDDTYVRNGSSITVSFMSETGEVRPFRSSVAAYAAYDLSVTAPSVPISITVPGTVKADAEDFTVIALYRDHQGNEQEMELKPDLEYSVTIDASKAGEHTNEVWDYTASIDSRIFNGKAFSVKGLYGNDAVTIPGAPAVNTDEEFVRTYASSLLSSLKSDEAFAFDTAAIVLSSGYYFNDWAQKQLGTTNLEQGTYKVDDSFSVEYWADDQDGGHVYTYNGFRISIPYGSGSYTGKHADVRVWGKGELYSNRAAGQDQVIAFEVIVEIDGNIYNAISDGFVFDFDKDPSDPTLFQGPLEVNGIKFGHVVINEYSM